MENVFFRKNIFHFLKILAFFLKKNISDFLKVLAFFLKNNIFLKILALCAAGEKK